MSEAERIGLYGGTFNPPHMGHERLAKACVEALKLDRLLLIPTAQPPHKQLPPGSAQGEQRAEMARLMAGRIPRTQVCGLELERPGPSYTRDTVDRLRQLYPEAEFWLIMGADMFLSFHKWREPERIAQQCSLAVAARLPDSRRQLERQAAFLERELGARSRIVDCPVTVLSSTQVRSHIPEGKWQGELAPEVADYIQKQGLYQEDPLEELRREVRGRMSEKRYRHTLGVEKTAACLAERFGEDVYQARTAALLHDLTKALDYEEQLKLCGRYGIITDYGENGKALLHADTAAALARQEFGVSEETAQAVAYHTTGAPGMTALDKIVYLADCIEPGREYPGVEKLRRLCKKDLDQAMICSLRQSIEHIQSKGGRPYWRTQRALEDFLAKKETGS